VARIGKAVFVPLRFLRVGHPVEQARVDEHP
jgi:hypothetical protein